MIKEELLMQCSECATDLRDRRTTVRIRCITHSELTRAAEAQGWYVDGFQDLCPKCQPRTEDVTEEVP